MSVKLCTSCFVCGESVELSELEELHIMYGKNIHPKICDKCKNAILHMRNQLENKEGENECSLMQVF